MPAKPPHDAPPPAKRQTSNTASQDVAALAAGIADVQGLNLARYVPAGPGNVSVTLSLSSQQAGQFKFTVLERVKVTVDPLTDQVTITGPAMLVRQTLQELQFAFNPAFNETFRITLEVKDGGTIHHTTVPILYDHDAGHHVTLYTAPVSSGGFHRSWSENDMQVFPSGHRLDSLEFEPLPGVRGGAPLFERIGAESVQSSVNLFAASVRGSGSPVPDRNDLPSAPLPLPGSGSGNGAGNGSNGGGAPGGTGNGSGGGMTPPVSGGGPTVTPSPPNNAPTDISLSSLTVNEAAADGITIGTLSSTDANSGDSFTYTLVDDAGGRFAVSGDALVVADGTRLDYETLSTHTIRVRTTDAGGLTVEKDFVITLNDVNETAPTDIALSMTSLNENAASGTLIGSLSSTDADSGDTFTYLLIDNAGGRFAISGSTLTVADGSLLDFEAATSHDVIIRTTDAAGNTYDETFTITLNNLNDNPTVNAVPAAQATDEDASLTFSAATGNAISVSDADGTPLTVTLTAALGTLSLTGTSGLSFAAGDGTTDSTMTFSGSASAINAALDGLSFAPTPNTSGAASIQITAVDGSGTPDSDTVAITVTPLADTPSVTNSTTQEDTQSTSGLVLTRHTDDGAEVTHYKITGITGGTLYLNDGITLIGEGSFITAAQGAAGLRFTPAPNSFAGGSFTAQAATAGNDASLGGGTVTATIAVSAVADTPSITSVVTLEDTQTATGLVITKNASDGAEVTHFQITGISGGTLYQNDGTTVINNGDFITEAQGTAGLKFTPAVNSNATGGFDVQASTSASLSGLGGSAARASITVTPVADTPSVTDAATLEDTQTTSGLIIARNAADDAEVTHFKISGITNGTLYQNDGVTLINNGDFITAAQGAAGLKFTPSADSFAAGSFTVQASTSNTDAGLGGSAVVANITVGAVADTPTVVSTTTLEDTQTASIAITQNAADGAEVTHYRITGISGGTLYQADGVTAIGNGDFITVAQGTAGLKFTPPANSNTAGGFDVQASTAASLSGLGGGIAHSTITVTPVADTPSVTGATTTEDTQTVSGLVLTPNAADGPEITHYKITGITGGALYQSDGTTSINNGDFITLAQGAAGLRFTPSADSIASGSFTSQAFIISNTDAGVSGSAVVATIGVTPVADTPSVTGATTSEGLLNATGLVISRAAVDGAEVTHFKITGITHGTLLKNDGVTVINNGDFITQAEGNAGLKFYSPTGNVTGTFDVRASTSNTDAGLGGGTVTASVTVNEVFDPPVISGLNSSVTYAENVLNLFPQLINTNAVTVTDPDTTSFTGGTLTVAMSAIAPTDLLSVRHQGGGAGQIGVSGNDITYGGTLIGTVSGGAGTSLVVTLNAGASHAAVGALLGNILYQTNSDTPLASQNALITLEDGSGGTSATQSIAVNITPESDSGTSFTLILGIDTIYAGSGNDTISSTSASFSAADTLYGAGGYDRVTFTNAATLGIGDFINKYGLDALAFAANGNALILDDPFIDASDNGSSIDLLNGVNTITSLDTSAVSAGNSVVVAGTGAVTLANNASRVVSQDGIDTSIIGGSANDTIIGGSGNDTFAGGVGNDSITGGSGNNTYNTLAADFVAGDSITGGTGTDILRFTNAASITASAQLDNKTGIDVLAFTANGNTVLLSDAIINASDSGDSLELANATFTITSLNTVAVTAPNRVIIGGTGAVTLAAVNNVVYAKDGVATNITGGTGNDTIIGGSGNDSLSGGAGNDLIVGGTGQDTLSGGTGADYFTFNTMAESAFAMPDRIANFSKVENDFIDLRALGFTGIQAGAASGTVLGYINNGVDTTIVDAAGTFRLILTGVHTALEANVVTLSYLLTASAADNLTGDANNNSFIGDAINFQAGDSITGGAGLDVLQIVTAATGVDAITVAKLANVSGIEVISFLGTGNTVTLSDAVINTSDGGTSIELANGGFTISSLNVSAVTSTKQVVIGGTGLVTLAAAGRLVSKDGVNTSITGSASNDTLIGGTGNDTLNASNGANTVHGGAGNDNLLAGSGADTINGGAGQDTIGGGSGADLFIFSAISDSDFAAPDRITDFNPGANDLIDLSALGFTGIQPGAASGNILGYTNNGTDTTIVNAAGTFRLVLTGVLAPDANLVLAGSTYTLTAAATDNLTGSATADIFTGTAANFQAGDSITGGAGVDVLTLTSSASGVNAVTAAKLANVTGIDILRFSAATPSVTLSDAFINSTDNGTYIIISQGANVLTLDTSALTGGNYATIAGTGAVTMAGTGGNIAVLDGVAGSITGSAGADTINGGSSADTFSGGAGADYLNGGGGADRFNYALGTDFLAAETVIGGSGNDLVAFSGIAAITAAMLANKSGIESFTFGNFVNSILFPSNYTIDGTSITLAGGAASSFTADVSALAIAASMTGGTAADTLIGGSASDTITAAAGADSVHGGAGNDSIVSAIADFIAADTLLGGTGTDTLSLSGGGTVSAALFASKSGFEIIALSNNLTSITLPSTYTFDTGSVLTLNGSAIAAANTLNADLSALTVSSSITGGTGNDTLLGGTFDDTIVGGAGNDSVNGNAGNDIIRCAATHFIAADTLIGGAGTDTLDFTGAFTLAGSAFANKSGMEVINLFNGTNNIAIGAGYTIDTGTTLTINGSSTTNAQIIALSGLMLDTSLTGGTAADSLIGSDANDTISGGNGNDTLSGGLGNDSLLGAAGSDIFQYTAAQFIAGDTIEGGASADSVVFSSGGTIAASAFANKTGIETFTTANAATSLTFASGYIIDTGTTLTLDGSATSAVQTFNVSALGINSLLLGGNANDSLSGGSGADTLRGGAGADSLALGLSDGKADRVQYLTVNDGAAAGANSGHDTLTQFELAADQILFGSTFNLNGGAANLDDIANDDNLQTVTNAAASFDTSHEALFITGLTDAALTQLNFTTLLSTINSYGITASSGETGLFIVQGASLTATYYYNETQATNTAVTTGEIKLLAVTGGLLTMSNFDFY